MKSKFIALPALSLAVIGLAAAATSHAEDLHMRPKTLEVDLSHFDEPIFPPDAPVIVRSDDGDMPETPNPHATPGPLGPDDTVFMLTPAPQINFRGGYAGYGDDYKNGGGVGVLVFIESGKLGVVLDVDAAGGQGDSFARLDGTLRIRARRPIDKNRRSSDLNDTAPRIWWGFGGDVGWRWSETQSLDSYLRVQPVAIFGTMRAFKDKKTKKVKCVIHAFVKGGLGLYDNQVNTTSANKWSLPWNNGTGALDTYVRPMVGAEGLAQCDDLGMAGNVRLLADAQHIFTFGPAGDTTTGKVQVSETWPVNGYWQVGYFAKGEVTHEWGGNFGSEEPASNGRTLPSVFGGLEVRW